MSSTCHFCGRKFTNPQAVRAHLKSCPKYQERRRTVPPSGSDVASGGIDLGSDGLGEPASGGADATTELFEPARQLRQRVATERLRLELRGVEEAHAELDRRAKTARQAREQEARTKVASAAAFAKEQRAEQRRAEEIRFVNEQKKIAEERRRTRRREVIQRVKTDAVENWHSGLLNDAELKSQVLRAIERKLASLPVTELPEEELIAIAIGLREPLFRAAQRKERAVREREARRRDLIEEGRRYAVQALRGVEGLDVSERWRIEERAKKELERFSGTESLTYVERIVDRVLEANGIDWDDDEDDD